MPRRAAPKPPPPIFAFEVPEALRGVLSMCPLCLLEVSPTGYVANRLIYRCDTCKQRFKPAVSQAAVNGRPTKEQMVALVEAGVRPII